MGGFFEVSAKHLVQRGNAWVCELYVPKDAQARLGLKVLRRTLQAATELEAIRERDRILPELRRQIALARDSEPADPTVLAFIARRTAALQDRIATLESELEKARAEIAFGRKWQAKLTHVPEAVIAAPTFAEVAELFIGSRVKAGTWKTGRPDSMDAKSRGMLKNHCGSIAGKAIASVTSGDVTRIMEAQHSEKLRSFIEQVWRYGRSLGHCQGDNPASLDSLALPAPKRDKSHHAAMHYQQVPAFMVRLAAIESIPAAALRFTILTAARKGEVAGMQWQEVDLQAKLWTVPAARMKAGRVHTVPLSPAAVAILKARQAAALPRDGGFVFPSRKGNAGLSHAAMDQVLTSLKADCTPHGFRSSFRDWCAETGQDDQASEFCLAHVVGGVKGAYLRTTVLELRRVIMTAWAAFLAG